MLKYGVQLLTETGLQFEIGHRSYLNQKKGVGIVFLFIHFYFRDFLNLQSFEILFSKTMTVFMDEDISKERATV